MSKSNDNLSAIPKLTPILSTEIIKTIDNEIIKSYLNISNKYKIPYSELESQKPNINKIRTHRFEKKN